MNGLPGKSIGYPFEILDLICKKLNLDPDYERFRSICKVWRSIAPKRCTKSLFLIRHQSSNFMLGTKFFYRISFQSNEILGVRGPSKSSSPSSILNNDDVICIGSSLGWMALIHHRTKSVFLYNPITNCIVNLPNFPNCSVHRKDRKCYEHIDFIISSDPVLSPTNCVALIMYDCSEKFIFCLIGMKRKTWIPLFSSSQEVRWGQRACFCNRNLYLTTSGTLYKCSELYNKYRYRRGERIRFADRIEEELADNDESYVVEMGRHLLLAIVTWPRSINEGYNIRLYKANGRRIDYSDGLEKVESLGDKAVFLSHKTSFCVTASDYSGCKKNSVYYVAKYKVGRRTTMKIRVHDLTDHSDVVMKDSAAASRRDWELCSWFAPSLEP